MYIKQSVTVHQAKECWHRSPTRSSMSTSFVPAFHLGMSAGQNDSQPRLAGRAGRGTRQLSLAPGGRSAAVRTAAGGTRSRSRLIFTSPGPNHCALSDHEHLDTRFFGVGNPAQPAAFPAWREGETRIPWPCSSPPGPSLSLGAGMPREPQSTPDLTQTAGVQPSGASRSATQTRWFCNMTFITQSQKKKV